MPGWRLPSNMPPDDVRGLPRRRESRAWALGLAVALLALVVIGYGARHELARLAAWTAGQRRVRTLSGTVVDARTGAPLAGVTVRVGSTGARYLALRPLPPPVWKTGTTSARGEFHIETRLLGEPVLYLQKPGYEDAVLQPDAPTGIRAGLVPAARAAAAGGPPGP